MLTIIATVSLIDRIWIRQELDVVRHEVTALQAELRQWTTQHVPPKVAPTDTPNRP